MTEVNDRLGGIDQPQRVIGLLNTENFQDKQEYVL